MYTSKCSDVAELKGVKLTQFGSNHCLKVIQKREQKEV